MAPAGARLLRRHELELRRGHPDYKTESKKQARREHGEQGIVGEVRDFELGFARALLHLTSSPQPPQDLRLHLPYCRRHR